MSENTTELIKRARKVTLKDVAVGANVSYATVSRVLNGIEDRFISDSTRKLVTAKALEMGYQPNRQARSLVTQRNLTVGVVFPALGANAMLSPFIHHTLNGVVNAAEELRQDILLLSAADRNRAEGSPEEVVDSRIDGLIFIAPPIDSSAVPIPERRGMPYAVIGGMSGGNGMVFNADNAGGVRLAMEHLVSLGHTRIAHVSGVPNQTDAIERSDAYRAFMLESGLPLREDYIISGNFRPEAGDEAAQRLLTLPEPPTAVFCANDGMAFGMIQAAAQLGLRVPEDLSVVGFDDHYLSAVYQPPLTTVRQPLDEMGAAALRAVVGLASGHGAVPHGPFSTNLVIRSTTARPMEPKK